MDKLIESLVKNPRGEYRRVLVRQDCSIAVFETDEKGASKRLYPIIERSPKNLSAALKQHADLVRGFVTGRDV